LALERDVFLVENTEKKRKEGRAKKKKIQTDRPKDKTEKEKGKQ